LDASQRLGGRERKAAKSLLRVSARGKSESMLRLTRSTSGYTFKKGILKKTRFSQGKESFSIFSLTDDERHA